MINNSSQLQVEIIGLKQSLIREKEQFSAIMRAVRDGIISTDNEGKILTLNKVAEKTTGWNKNEVVGLPLMKIFQIYEEKSEKPINISPREAKQGVMAILQDSKGKNHFVDQHRLNVITNRFPKATFGITDKKMIIAYNGKEPVGSIMPLEAKGMDTPIGEGYDKLQNKLKTPEEGLGFNRSRR